MTETAHTPLPCPFCSGDAIIIHDDRVWIECADCPSKAEVGPFDTEADALTAWNTRADSHHRLVEALTDVGASLAAAISLLERGGKAAKKAAPSDRMFDQMVKDYKASLERARAALKEAGR